MKVKKREAELLVHFIDILDVASGLREKSHNEDLLYALTEGMHECRHLAEKDYRDVADYEELIGTAVWVTLEEYAPSVEESIHPRCLGGLPFSAMFNCGWHAGYTEALRRHGIDDALDEKAWPINREAP